MWTAWVVSLARGDLVVHNVLTSFYSTWRGRSRITLWLVEMGITPSFYSTLTSIRFETNARLSVLKGMTIDHFLIPDGCGMHYYRLLNHRLLHRTDSPRCR